MFQVIYTRVFHPNRSEKPPTQKIDPPFNSPFKFLNAFSLRGQPKKIIHNYIIFKKKPLEN